MPGFIEQLAAQQGQNAANGIMGLVLGDINDRRQVRQQQRLTNQQLDAQKDMGEYNYQQQMRMWKETNYKAQMEQLKMAGLNPGLLYGMGGSGGTTVGHQGGSVGGGSAVGQGGEVQAMMGMGMQRELLQAQKENIEADTANKRASNPNIQADTEGKGLTNTFLRESMKDRIDTINTEAAIAIAELDIKEGERTEQRMSRIDRMNKIKAEAIGELINNGLMEMQKKGIIQNIAESKAKVINMQQQIEQGLRGLDQKDTELKIREFEAMIKAEFPSLWNVIGGAVNGIIQMGSGNNKPQTYKSPTQ